jgi:hypothetical protein
MSNFNSAYLSGLIRFTPLITAEPQSTAGLPENVVR